MSSTKTEKNLLTRILRIFLKVQPNLSFIVIIARKIIPYVTKVIHWLSTVFLKYFSCL